MRVFVGTDILVHLFDAEEPTKQARAREVVRELARIWPSFPWSRSTPRLSFALHRAQLPNM